MILGLWAKGVALLGFGGLRVCKVSTSKHLTSCRKVSARPSPLFVLTSFTQLENGGQHRGV